MAYSTEKAEDLMEFNKGSNLVKVRHIENDRGTYVDIREFYQDEDEEKWLPSKKGIRFNSENTADVIKALLGTLDVSELDDIIEAAQEKIDEQ